MLQFEFNGHTSDEYGLIVTQIEEKLQISVHITSQEDIRPYLAEKPGLLIEQEEEQEWFIRCPVS